ncbi:Rha family transcriptional regulator [Priestia aryabhattai]|uniref:Rha family transcriptional regulator n=1 Tax=Priestia aryabhattai TaxID=412384 RepID=UPI0015F6BA9E|nr:DUF559 domain-containing protein [Priestia aryabhattai]
MFTDSLNIANQLNYEHKEILRRIRKVAKIMLIDVNSDSDFIKKDLYINTQNKPQPYYKLSKVLTVEVLKTFNRVNRDKVKELLDNFKLVEPELSPKTIAENQFYNILSGLIGKENILRQFNVLNYFIDFYIPKINIFVEFDENYHKKNMIVHTDIERQDKILEFSRRSINKDIEIIRVSEEDIYGGLRDILKLYFKESYMQ